MDIFSTQVLSKVVERLHTPPSFLLDTFFPNVQTSDKEEIFFDVTDSKPRISPFVSPLLPGKVVDGGGYQTKSFKPAYVKDKRRFDANIPYKRVAGETIGGSLSPAQRYERALATHLKDQLDNLTRREEVMAAEILSTGKVVVSGDGYPAQTVNFGRDEALTKALASSATWDSSGVNPVDDLEDWAITIQDKSGVVAKTVVMDPQAWKIFRSNETVQKYLDIRRGTNNSLAIDPALRSEDAKARNVGSIAILIFGSITTLILMMPGLRPSCCRKRRFCLVLARVWKERDVMARSTMKKPTGRRNATLQSLGLRKIRACVGCCCNPRRWSFLIVQTLPCV